MLRRDDGNVVVGPGLVVARAQSNAAVEQKADLYRLMRVRGDDAGRADEDGSAVPRVVLRVADGLGHGAGIVPRTRIVALPFAAINGSTHALVAESLVLAAFALIAVLGFKFGPWLVGVGLAAHGVFDVLHPALVRNPGVPAEWPAFCLTFDVGAAALLAMRLKTRTRPAFAAAASHSRDLPTAQ